jgi:dihydrodipicolinate synthase/N-acetylneuraminate lyase
MDGERPFRVFVNLAMPLDHGAAAADKAQYPISRESTAHLVRYVIPNGVDGVVIGDRVELGRMSYEERELYFAQTIQAIDGAAPTYPLASSSSDEGAIRLVKLAGRAGATGIIASFPGTLPNKGNLAGYFRRIIESASQFDLEVFLAEEPRGESITSELMDELGYRGINGIVWSRYDTLDLDTIRIEKPDQCLIFARNDYVGRELGNDIDGVISDLANIDPIGIGYFFRQLREEKHLTKKLGQVWARYMPLLRLMRNDRIMVRASIDNALAHTFPEGFPVFSLRPQGKLNPAQERQLRSALEQLRAIEDRRLLAH